MIFSPELAVKVLAGEKTVTRRLVSSNPRSPWHDGGCSLVLGRDYAVCPGRGKGQVGRVRVTAVARERLWYCGEDDAVREGFANAAEFREAWTRINGGYDPDSLVWRIAFVLVQEGRL